MRSTTHAVCCGTKRITVLVGVLLEEEKYEGGPDCDLDWPTEEKMLGGGPEAAELYCEKWRRAGLARAAAAPLDVASGREARSRFEAVEATNRLCDAMLYSGAKW
jgi:hypothetical protein